LSDSAASGAGGRWFKSSHPDHFFSRFPKTASPAPDEEAGLFVAFQAGLFNGLTSVFLRTGFFEGRIFVPVQFAVLIGIDTVEGL
jgi:hypothetical protein